LGGQLGEPIKFTERDVLLIANSVPFGTDPKRIEIMPLLLREWAQVELRWHLATIPLPLLAQQRVCLNKVAKRATALIQALDKLEGLDRWELVERLGIAQGLELVAVYRNQQNKYRVDEWRSLTATIAAIAAEPTWKPGKGQPRNDVAQLVLQDLAAMFEYVTGLRASRVVDRHTREESGHFPNFTRAVWPVVFGNGDFGLASQLRVWADGGSKSSMLMNGIALRRPEWGVIPTGALRDNRLRRRAWPGHRVQADAVGRG
jgi:hypothetical protein